jgi:hypothetical protein
MCNYLKASFAEIAVYDKHIAILGVTNQIFKPLVFCV